LERGYKNYYSIIQGGKAGADRLALSIAEMAASFSGSAAVQELASALKAELSNYDEPEQDVGQRQKPKHRRSPER